MKKIFFFLNLKQIKYQRKEERRNKNVQMSNDAGCVMHYDEILDDMHDDYIQKAGKECMTC